MYQVEKVLNNNGILAIDLETQIEYIFVGKGIGFHNKENQQFERLDDVKKYKLQNEKSSEDSLSVVNNVDPIYFDISNEIILVAEQKFGGIDTKIMLSLADHISFAIERIKNNLNISNPFTSDIRALFLEEYEVALKARDIIKEYTGVTINDDEIGYITLHIHSALTSEHVSRTMSVAILVSNMIEEIEQKFDIHINKDSLSYNRLMTHIKYMITRVLKDEELKVDMSLYVKTEFPYAFEVAKELCAKLAKELNRTFSEVEIGYLAIHIERVRLT